MKKRTSADDVLEAVLKKTPPHSLPEASAERPFEEVRVSDGEPGGAHEPRKELLRGIHLKVRAELGRCRMPLKEALRLVPGSVVDLEKLAEEPVDLYIGDTLLARGEVILVNDSFCVRVTDVLPATEGEA